MLTDSSKFLIQARHIGNRYEDIFLASNPVSEFTIGVIGPFSDSLIIQSRQLFFKKNSMKTINFFCQDFRSGQNIFSSVN